MEFIWPVSLVIKDEQHSGLNRYSVFGWNGVREIFLHWYNEFVDSKERHLECCNCLDISTENW